MRIDHRSPRYTHMWDLDIMLNYLDFDSTKVDLLTLSRKAVSLLTLLSGQRVSTIHSIQFDDVKWSGDFVSIVISSIIKQTRVGFSTTAFGV